MGIIKIFFNERRYRTYLGRQKDQSGGCWSFKKMENESAQLWEDLSVGIVGENLENNEDINGLSICLKRQSNSVIKIWNNNSKKNQINLLNKDILNKYDKDILYIAHIQNFNKLIIIE